MTPSQGRYATSRKRSGLSLHSCLLLEVAYSPFGFRTCRDDVRHVRDASFLAQLFQLSLLSFGDIGHLLLLLRKRDAASVGVSCGGNAFDWRKTPSIARRSCWRGRRSELAGTCPSEAVSVRTASIALAPLACTARYGRLLWRNSRSTFFTVSPLGDCCSI